MKSKDFNHKIPYNNSSKDNINSNHKYSSRICSLNNRILSNNFTSDTSDSNSLNKMNYSAFIEFNL